MAAKSQCNETDCSEFYGIYTDACVAHGFVFTITSISLLANSVEDNIQWM